MKRLSLQTYHIRNKNGSPTAQVTILKDNEDLGDEPGADTASVSQSTTTKGVSPLHQKSKLQSQLFTTAASNIQHASILKKLGSTQSNTKPPDEEQCRGFNADIMRTLVARKMAKQKTFYEMKVQEQNPIIINNINPVNRMLLQPNHQSLGGGNAIFMKTKRLTMNSPPNVRRLTKGLNGGPDTVDKPHRMFTGQI